MNSFRKEIIILIALSSLVLYDCSTGDDPKSMQPTDGYPFTTDMKEIKGILKYRGIDTMTFRRGEIIADIGAGNGYIEAILSMFHDSLTFYIQDIDTSVCNESAISEVLDFYQNVNGRPFTNRFIVVTGTDTETNLPDNTFDKILMIYTYQYLKKPKVFIKEERNS